MKKKTKAKVSYIMREGGGEGNIKIFLLLLHTYFFNKGWPFVFCFSLYNTKAKGGKICLR
jgi:hypothetical protein